MRLVTVALLVTYLVSKHRARVRIWTPRKAPSIWTGKGIDTTTLKPKIDRVRRDYLAAQASGDKEFRRRLLLVMARAVRQLSFFRRREAGEDVHHHAT